MPLLPAGYFHLQLCSAAAAGKGPRSHPSLQAALCVLLSTTGIQLPFQRNSVYLSCTCQLKFFVHSCAKCLLIFT